MPAKKIEQLGIIGDVDGAEKAMKELDDISERRKKLEEVVEKERERGSGNNETFNCESPLSGVYLNTHDNEQRVRDHKMGKQYSGWKTIRELKERLADILRNGWKGKEGRATACILNHWEARRRRRGGKRGRERKRSRA